MESFQAAPLRSDFEKIFFNAPPYRPKTTLTNGGQIPS